MEFQGSSVFKKVEKGERKKTKNSIFLLTETFLKNIISQDF